MLTAERLAGAPFSISSEYRADFVCGIAIGLLNEVHVDIKGRRRVRSTQAAAHRPHGHAFRSGTGRQCWEVPEIVQTN